MNELIDWSVKKPCWCQQYLHLVSLIRYGLAGIIAFSKGFDWIKAHRLIFCRLWSEHLLIQKLFLEAICLFLSWWMGECHTIGELLEEGSLHHKCPLRNCKIQQLNLYYVISNQCNTPITTFTNLKNIKFTRLFSLIQKTWLGI